MEIVIENLNALLKTTGLMIQLNGYALLTTALAAYLCFVFPSHRSY